MFKYCKYCGKEFKIKPSHYAKTVYCSIECRWAESRVIKTCLTCGIEFHSKKARANITKYCSRACMNKQRMAAEKECLECHKFFKVSPTQINDRKFCSRVCWMTYRARTIKYKIFTCQGCNKTFKSYEPNENFCSMDCKIKSCGRIKQCDICKKEIRIRQSHADKVVYCSMKCMTIGYRIRLEGENNPNFKNAGWHKCVTCNISFRSYNKYRKYCSQKCYRDREDSMPRRGYNKRDHNHQEIIDALRVVGCSIIDLADQGRGCPDIMAAIDGKSLLIEIKNPNASPRLTKAQQEWHKTWMGPKAIVYSAREAITEMEKLIGRSLVEQYIEIDKEHYGPLLNISRGRIKSEG